MCWADFCAAAAIKAAVLVYGCLGGGKIDAVLRTDGGGAFFAERAAGGNEISG